MTSLAFASSSASGSGAAGAFASFVPLIIIFLIGYFFYKRVKKNAQALPPNPNLGGSHVGSGWKVDKILIALGVVGLLFSFSMDTSVVTGAGGRVNNIGLMNDKQNYLILSGIFLLVGVILNIANRNKTQKENVATSSSLEDEYKICPFCAEQIRKQAKLCRFCGKDQKID